MVLQAVGHINLLPWDNGQVTKASVVPFHFNACELPFPGLNLWAGLGAIHNRVTSI